MVEMKFDFTAEEVRNIIAIANRVQEGYSLIKRLPVLHDACESKKWKLNKEKQIANRQRTIRMM
jgi:hypothetical protein